MLLQEMMSEERMAGRKEGLEIAGMIDESMDTEQMKRDPEPWEFRVKPAWQRLIIMVGGVTVNFILALFIYSMIMFHWGESYVRVEVSQVVAFGKKALEAVRKAGWTDAQDCGALLDHPAYAPAAKVAAELMQKFAQEFISIIGCNLHGNHAGGVLAGKAVQKRGVEL